MNERLINCKKLQESLPGLDSAPYPGELGEKIYNEISQKAWDQWLSHQTMLINEYRLSLIDPEAKKFLKEEMQRFLFENKSAPPPGFNDDTQPSD